VFLPDVNVWLALTFESHVHHGKAKRWFAGVPDQGCAFCRLTQQGFLRLATNPAAFGDEAVSLADAWELYDRLTRDPRVCYAVEPSGLEVVWRFYSRRRVYSPKVWNDAYLAGFARAGDLDLVTLDRGFRQFPGLKCTVLA